MRNLGPLEIVVILAVVLLFFGANRLPQLGRAVGDTIREFKKSMKQDESEEPSNKS